MNRKLGPESVILAVHGCEVRVPAAPLPCEYVRIVDVRRREILYWDVMEWREDPVGVMGAILAAIRCVALGEDL